MFWIYNHGSQKFEIKWLPLQPSPLILHRLCLCMETIDFLWGFESNWNLEFFDSDFFLFKKTKTNGYETKSITHRKLDGDLIVHHLGFDSASLLCWVLSYPEFGCKNEFHCYWITLQNFHRVCISHINLWYSIQLQVDMWYSYNYTECM
jgi:hypothetical protein